mmetsp:Transcript_24000/g.38572  ORF Transcript_24000/g.38572 Transcript_24000/m.38572 type:complete len:764 (-) Transcript_24000:199-2490(-)|eukprot:CAMPEP_0202703956 /NCGR_PEP_ID=MMETSP1385-20130828/16728_1 /ASSEMBLY_ACC=CAM_ASM_000861 /TAXON_ID=933848 /ORGANISM="Elphidium margaritaceum" /LENGTH=763 /DNA_ID=CAMNT_0049361887 /DNA_START=66 /DNA_END=2357 /DNA_ORIENTATION=-
MYFTISVLLAIRLLKQVEASLPLLDTRMNLFDNEHVRDRRNDDSTTTIYDEFLVFFSEDCLALKGAAGVDPISSLFDDVYTCYTQDAVHKDHRGIGDDYWILVHKTAGCTANENTEIVPADYCVTEVDENEKWNARTADCSVRVTTDALWNLFSISETHVVRGVETAYLDGSDADINIVVFDSGIDDSHSQFSGVSFQRLFNGYADADPGNFHSHGTHVSGTILGKTYGIVEGDSSNVNLLDVRTLDQAGFASWAVILQGLDAIEDWLNADPSRKAIINHSWGGPVNAEVNDAIDVITAIGGINIVAAGNDNADAATKTPASALTAITVGALTANNAKADFSNFGPTVDIWAPGVDILSATPNEGSAVWQGTSMAAPLVTGVVANLFAFQASDATFDRDAALDILLANALNDVNDGVSANCGRLSVSCGMYEQESSQCLPQGVCNSGYMDKTDGNYYYWACGSGCVGGTYYTDYYCNCACITATQCDNAYYRFNSKNYDSYFWTHYSGAGSKIASLSATSSYFEIVPSLVGDGEYVSFRSATNSDQYLRHSGYYLKLNTNDGSSLFQNDASFKVVSSLIGDEDYSSFESKNYPGFYIRHASYKLQISTGDGSTLFKNDASFRIEAVAELEAATGGPDSCFGSCGGSSTNCWCDSYCSSYGDCCDDKVAVCGTSPIFDVDGPRPRERVGALPFDGKFGRPIGNDYTITLNLQSKWVQTFVFAGLAALIAVNVLVCTISKRKGKAVIKYAHVDDTDVDSEAQLAL